MRSIPVLKCFLQMMLVYTEAILICQYIYQIPTRLRCSFVTPEVEADAKALGLHRNSARSIFVFLAYLSTLMHTYKLVRQQAGSVLLFKVSGASVQDKAGLKLNLLL